MRPLSRGTFDQHASVIPSNNTNATVYAIAERGRPDPVQPLPSRLSYYAVISNRSPHLNAGHARMCAAT
ncbi:hypothetical protein [Streptomyces sp. NPDC057428]|uniref:hypothetical protein n=1 Tax=Streptomyces sp. NPDC057428 TaxID=3346129 RepID=UPI0036CD68DE